jgi:hypothetical protein
MESLFYAVLVACSWSGPACSAAPPFTITIAAKHDTIRAADELLLMITLINNTDQTISITHQSAECEYTALVWDAPGHMAPDTEYGFQVKNWYKLLMTRGFVMRGGKLYLPPCMTENESKGGVNLGEPDVDYLVVNDLYDMTHPGQYTIQVERKIPKELHSPEPLAQEVVGVVKSNIITVTVTE